MHGDALSDQGAGDPVVARRATAAVYELGESPRWDRHSDRWYWCDIAGGKVWSASEAEPGVLGEPHLERALCESVTSVNRVGDDLVLTTGDRILHGASFDGLLATDSLIDRSGGRRFNDAAADPAGRLFVGTLSEQDDEALYRWDGADLTVVRSQVQLSNGIGWSPDGAVMYHVDSRSRTLSAAPYEMADGSVGPWATVRYFPDGYPDGLHVDTDGCIWVAVWGRAEVQRIGPSGEWLECIAIAAANTTACAVGGPDGSTMLITSAWTGLTQQERQTHPASGAIFTTRLPKAQQ